MAFSVIFASAFAGKLPQLEEQDGNKIEDGAGGDSPLEEIQTFGFVCPGNEPQCHAHCRSIGMQGGKCGGFLSMRCDCWY